MSRPIDEGDLVRGLASGNSAAFTLLYHRYRDRVYLFAHRMLANQELAEDVTHEAFLVLIEHPERYQSERGSVHTFLCAVARNHILLHLRKDARNAKESLDEFEGSAVLEDEKAIDPLENLLDQELSAKINDSLKSLPPLQREAIVLREFEGLTYEEIGQVVSVDVNVVKARLHRARQSLIRLLEAYLKTEEDEPYEMRTNC